MKISKLEDRDDLRSLYWRLVKEKFNFRAILTPTIEWDADTFEEMFYGYWEIFKIVKDNKLLGIVATVKFEGKPTELCAWRSQHGTARQAVEAGRYLIPKLVASCKTLIAFAKDEKVLKLHWLMGAEVDFEKGESLWAVEEVQLPKHQSQHQHPHL